MSIPQELMAEAEAVGADSELLMTDALQEAAPQGSFSADALNRLVNEVNKILPKMGMELYPTFAADLTVFPAEFVDVIMGINEAAAAAGLDMAIDLSVVESDRDLAMLAATISEIAADEAFLEFIAGNQGEEEVVVEEDVVVEEPVAEDEELFLERM